MEINLNPQQKLAAGAPHGPLLIVAGAGTGKTRTLTARIVHFVEQGIPPQKICAITFTNKAAKEMAERISDAKNANPRELREGGSFDSRHSHAFVDWRREPFIGTFHSLGAKILRGESRLLGRKPNFAIFDNDDSFSLVKKVVKSVVPKTRGGESKMAALRQTKDKNGPAFFARKISEIKSLNGVWSSSSQDRRPCDDKISEIFQEYENELRKNNSFDFDDLIEKPVALFLKYPDLLKKYQNKFAAILVDEYQDLNPKQYEFVRLLAGGHKNLSVVGDDEQMIYGWRHADIKIFLGFERDWPGARIAFLEENYRSTGNIIRAAQSVAENNRYRRPKNLLTKNSDGPPVKIAELEDEEREAEWIAGAIANSVRQIANSETKKDGVGHLPFAIGYSPSAAVLYRTNAQSRAIEQALIHRQIPYKIFGGVRFYERKEIKDIVAALRWVFNPEDAVSRERLEKNLSKTRFSALKEAFTEAKDKTPAGLIGAFLKNTDYLDYLERNFLNADERRKNVEELARFASGSGDLGRFLEEIALAQPTDMANSRWLMADSQKADPTNHLQSATGHSPVNLMTIHLSKGLEFDRVFIAGCSEGLLPHAMSSENEYHLEEERRLMYVAMTRAKQELCISFYDLPSRFIGEIPEELTEYCRPRAEEDAAGEESEKFVYLD